MLDPTVALFGLVPELGSTSMASWPSRSPTRGKSIARRTPWFAGSLGHFENKSRMKQLGAFINFSRDLLREFCILGMAKVLEDVLDSARFWVVPSLRHMV